jgi:nicotinamidase-related amidase
MIPITGAAMDPLILDVPTTALILIDLQHAIVGRSLVPRSSAEVVQTCCDLAGRFRRKGAMVVYVRVDLADMQIPVADQPARDPSAPPPPAKASELVPQVGFQAGDVLITKRYWGAFGGTDLERQLRQRGIHTIVLGGIATNFGVESTARTAAELGFSVVLIEDAMASFSDSVHRFAIETIFPRLGRVRAAEQVQL